MNGLTNGTKNDPKFEEISIPVPWGQISAKWWGPRNTQPIIALHGWQDNAGTFDALAPLLVERGHSVLCIDMPGHGFSSHYSPGHYYYIFWDGLHLLRRIVKHFRWSDVTIVGHSLGGGIAFLYAAVYPDDTKRYVSFDIASPSVRTGPKIIDAMGDSIDKFLKYETLKPEDVPCYDYEEMLQIVEQAYKGGLTRESCEIMMRRGMKPAGDGVRYLFTRDPRLKVSALGLMSLDHVLEFAARIKCDVLNVRAKEGIKFPGYEEVLDAIEKSARKVERRVVDGTHHVHLNDAESVVDVVAAFLEE